MYFIKKALSAIVPKGQPCKKKFRLAQARGRAVCNDAMAIVNEYKSKHC